MGYEAGEAVRQLVGLQARDACCSRFTRGLPTQLNLWIDLSLVPGATSLNLSAACILCLMYSAVAPAPTATAGTTPYSTYCNAQVAGSTKPTR